MIAGRVWVELKNGLPRSAVGEKPSLGEFERYYPESEVEELRVRVAELEKQLMLAQAALDGAFV